MLNISHMFNGLFEYNNNSNSFYCDIIKLYIPNYSDRRNVYELLSFYSNVTNKAPHSKQICALCRKYGGDRVYADTMQLHSKCSQILDNIICKKPIFNIKLSYNDSLSVYGIINNYIVTRADAFIELWEFNVDLLNNSSSVYGHISGTLRTEQLMKHINCSYCWGTLESRDNYYFIGSKVYCVDCSGRVVQFTNSLVSKYMLIKCDLIADISGAVVRLIINMYQALSDLKEIF